MANALYSKLHAIADKLHCNVSKKGVRVQAVAKALADSGAQIDRCLMDFNVRRMRLRVQNAL